MGRLNVELAFTANTSQAAQQLKSLKTELTQLGNLQINPGTKVLTNDLISASNAAIGLKAALEAATNVNTGKLSLSKFNQELKASGMSLADYRTKLSAIGPEGQQAFIQLTNSIMQADAAIGTGSKLLGNFAQTLANVAKYQISNAVYRGITSAISSAYNYAKDLNEELNNIRIVTGQSADQMDKFAARANDTAKQLSTTTQDYVKASLIFYQQGLSDKEVEARTNATIKLANVTRQSAEQVSSQMTAIWNNFADGSDNLEYFADVITALGAATASSSQEISEGLSKFAAIANTVGLSYEYATTALSTVVAQTRQSADVVGTAFKTLFARLDDLKLGETLEDGVDLGKYSKALQTVGVDILDANGELRQMDAILDDLGGKWDSLSKATQTAVAETVAGKRQYTQFVALLDNWDKFQENLEVAKNSEGTLSKQADIYAESWEGASKRAKAAAESLYSSLLDDDFFIKLTNGLASFIEGINNVIKGMGGLKGLLPTITSLLLTFAGPQIYSGISKIGTSIMNLIPNFKAMGQAVHKSGIGSLRFISMGETRGEKIRQEAADEQKKVYANDTSDLGKSQMQAVDRRLTLQNLYNDALRQASDIEKEQMKSMMERQELAEKSVITAQQEVAAAKERQAILEESIKYENIGAKDSSTEKSSLIADLDKVKDLNSLARAGQSGANTILTGEFSAKPAEDILNSKYFQSNATSFGIDKEQQAKYQQALETINNDNATDDEKKQAQTAIEELYRTIYDNIKTIERAADDQAQKTAEGFADNQGISEDEVHTIRDQMRQNDFSYNEDLQSAANNESFEKAQAAYGDKATGYAAQTFIAESQAIPTDENIEDKITSLQEYQQLLSDLDINVEEYNTKLQELSGTYAAQKTAEDELQAAQNSGKEGVQEYLAAEETLRTLKEQGKEGTAEYAEAEKALAELRNSGKEGIEACVAAEEKLAAAKDRVAKAEDQVRNAQGKAGATAAVQAKNLDNAEKAAGRDAKTVKTLAAEQLKEARAENTARQARIKANKSFKDAVSSMSKMGKGLQTVGNVAMQGVKGLSSLASAASMVVSAFRTFSDDSIPTTQKLITALTLLGPVIGMVSNGFASLSQMGAIARGMMVQNTAATYQELIAKKASGAADLELLGGLKKKVAAMSVEQIAQITGLETTEAAALAKSLDSANTWADVPAKYADATATLAAEAAATPLLVVTLALVAAFIALVAIIALVVMAFKSMSDGYNADAIAAEKATERYNQQAEALKEVKEEYNNLSDALDSYKEKQANIDNMVEGTKQWKEAVREANLEILDLISKYPTLGENLKNINGRLEISDESMDKALAEMEAKVQTQTAHTMSAKVSMVNATNRADRTQVLRNAGFSHFEGEWNVRNTPNYSSPNGQGTNDYDYKQTELRKSAEKLYDALVREYQAQGEAFLTNGELKDANTTLTEKIIELSEGNTELQNKFTENIDSIKEQIIATAENTKANVAVREALIDTYNLYNKDYQNLDDKDKAYAQAKYENAMDENSEGYNERWEAAKNRTTELIDDLEENRESTDDTEAAARAAAYLETVLAPELAEKGEQAKINFDGENTVTLGDYQIRDIYGDGMSLYKKNADGVWELTDAEKDMLQTGTMDEEIARALMAQDFDFTAAAEEAQSKRANLIAAGFDEKEDSETIEQLIQASASPNIDYDLSNLSLQKLQSLDLSKIDDTELQESLTKVINGAIEQLPKEQKEKNETFASKEGQESFWAEQKQATLDATGFSLSEMDDYIKKFSEYGDKAEQVATSTARTQAQVESLNSEFSNQSKKLTESSKNSTTYTKAMGKMLEALNKTLLGEIELNEEDLYNAAKSLSETTGEDIDQVELLKRAAEGSTDAIEALHTAAAQKMVLDWGLDANIEAQLASFVEDGNVTADELATLNSLVQDGIVDAEKATILLSQLDYIVDNIDGKLSIAKKAITVDTSNLASLTDTDDNSSSEDSIDPKKYSDEIERYHQSTRDIDKLTKAISRLNDEKDELYGGARIAQMDAVIDKNKELLDTYEAQKDEINSYLEMDKAILSAAGAIFDENGEVSNYVDLRESWVDQYNAGQLTDDEYESLTNAFDNYEEGLDKLEDVNDQIDEINDEIKSLNYEKITYKVEIDIDLDDRELSLLEYNLKRIEDDGYKTAEAMSIVSSELTIGQKKMATYADEKKQLDDAYTKGKITMSDYVEGLKSVQENELAEMENLDTLQKQMLEYYGNTLTFAMEQIDKYDKKISNVATKLSHFQKVLDMSGYKEDWTKQIIVLDGLIQNNLDAKASNEAQLSMLQKQLEETKTRRDQTREGSEDRKKADEDIEALENQITTLEGDLRNNIEKDLEYLSKRAEMEVKNIFSEAQKSITELQDSYKHLTEMSNGWLDNVNKVYETNKLLNNINKEIDKTTNTASKNQYNSFAQHVKQLQQRDKLSKADLEIANKQFAILQAKIALEEAQNAKNNVRLQRNAEGGYGFVYTADETKTADAEQKVEDTENQLYNYDLKTQQDNQSKMLTEEAAYLQKRQDIWTKWGQGYYESEAERDAELEKLEQQHKEKMELYNHDLTTAVETNHDLLRVMVETNSSYIATTVESTNLRNKNSWENFGNKVTSTISTIETDINEKTPKMVSDLNTVRGSIKANADTIGATSDDGLRGSVNALTSESASLKDAIIDPNTGVVHAMDELLTTVGDEVKAFTSPGGMSEAIDTVREKFEKEYTAINKVLEELNKLDGKKTSSTHTHTTIYKIVHENVTASGDGDGNGDGDVFVPETKEFTADQIRNMRMNKEDGIDIGDGSYVFGINGKQWIFKEGADIVFLTSPAVYNRVEPADPDSVTVTSVEGYDIKKQFTAFDTGGYTGEWDSSGKIAMLHQKELILNENDTENILSTVDSVRLLAEQMNLKDFIAQLKSNINTSNNVNWSAPTQSTVQNIEINASFPNAENQYEIQSAFEGLFNRVSQYANSSTFNH